MIRFGPAGAADSFAAMGYKKTAQMPEYLEKMGLTAFEYQCGRGVRITDEAARALGEGFRQRDIAVSLHAPYYISMSSLDEEKRLGSLRYILESARAKCPGRMPWNWRWTPSGGPSRRWTKPGTAR